MHRRPAKLVACVVALLAASAAADDSKPVPSKDAAVPAKPAAAAKDPKAAAAPKDAKPATVAARSTAPQPKTLDEALRLLARRRVDVQFDEAALDDAVSFIAAVGSMNVMVSPEFVRSAAGAAPRVTLTLRDISLRQLAELVAKTTGTALVFRDGVLQFTTPADARGRPVLRIFPIEDLTFRVRNFPGPDITLHTGDAKFVQEEESDRESPFDDPEKVVELLRKFTGEGTWDDDDVSISADRRKIVVRQYPKVLKEIGAFLAVLRAAK